MTMGQPFWSFDLQEFSMLMYLERELRRATAAGHCGDPVSYHQRVYAKHIPFIQERYLSWHAFSI